MLVIRKSAYLLTLAGMSVLMSSHSFAQEGDGLDSILVQGDAGSLEDLPPTSPVPPPLPVPPESQSAEAVEQAPATVRSPAPHPSVDPTEVRSQGLGFSVQGTSEGLKVVGMIVGGPAESAGVQLGDIVKSINGTAVQTTGEFKSAADSVPGEATQIEIVRNGAVSTVSANAGQGGATVVQSPVDSSGPPQSYSYSQGQRYSTQRARVRVSVPGFYFESNTDIPASIPTRPPVSVVRPRIVPPIGPPPVVRRAIRWSAPPVPPIGPRRVFVRPGRVRIGF